MRFTAIILAALLLALPAYAAVDGTAIRLLSGEVKGKVKGQGRASVSAEVSNTGGKNLAGIRIGVFYSASNSGPGEGAKWRVHEFVFEPPLAPGKTTQLHFSDENALEYIMLDVQRVQYAASVGYNGRRTALCDRGDVMYIGARDLLELIGGSLGYDAKTSMVTLKRDGVEVRVKPGLSYALVGGKQQPLAYPVVEENGRSLLPLNDLAAFFSLAVKPGADDGEWELQ